MFRLSSILVVTLVFMGCASTGKAVSTLDPGMSKQQVLEALGTPADRSFHGSDEAWQYQEIAGVGQCKYTTVWISNGKLIGVSTRRGKSVAGCGLGSKEVVGARCRPSSEAGMRQVGSGPGVPSSTGTSAEAEGRCPGEKAQQTKAACKAARALLIVSVLYSLRLSRPFRPHGVRPAYPGHRPSASALGWALPARWAGLPRC